MHSFGLTERHAVLPRQPVYFDAMKVMTRPMHEAFVEIDSPSSRFGETENGFYLVPLEGDGAVRAYSLPEEDRLYYTHTVRRARAESPAGKTRAGRRGVERRRRETLIPSRRPASSDPPAVDPALGIIRAANPRGDGRDPPSRRSTRTKTRRASSSTSPPSRAIRSWTSA